MEYAGVYLIFSTAALSVSCCMFCRSKFKREQVKQLERMRLHSISTKGVSNKQDHGFEDFYDGKKQVNFSSQQNLNKQAADAAAFSAEVFDTTTDDPENEQKKS
eukprot:CAMPEP_0175165010 /NCGR_PEP_ID=MMETSP0087-20121206/26791_1 /TAXON_ID=136419 /ORGANISM="Unknown Unknown, Strain D1" /LENGTH=103 /DNA_ID=CAMNT_0016454225 /DNA_START=296 /DNA_END=607 /DNA_ORIENTATION=-